MDIVIDPSEVDEDEVRDLVHVFMTLAADADDEGSDPKAVSIALAICFRIRMEELHKPDWIN